MNTLKKIPTSVILLIIVVSLQTLASLLPGVILIEHKVTFTFSLLAFIIYLFWSQIFEYMLTHKDFIEHRFPIKVFVVKFIISMLFIIIITQGFTYQYGLILLSYEVFHFLLFSEQFNYQRSLLYFILNAIYKGMVFNLIISISYPYNFQLIYFQPYIFSTLMILTASLILKIVRSGSPESLRKDYFILLLSFLLMLGYLLFKTQQQNFSITISLLVILATVLGFGLGIHWRQTKNELAQIVVISSTLLSLLLFYLN